MVIEANLVPTLIHTLRHGEFKTQKEAAWAVSNFTVGGTTEQVGVLLSQSKEEQQFMLIQYLLFPPIWCRSLT